MAKPNQTVDDWKTFRGISAEKRAEYMYLYLVKGYTMPEVAEKLWGKDKSQYSHHVSLVHRCYNFDSKGSRNSGRFSGAKFGDEVTREDIKAFVKKYPQGIDADDSSDPGSGIEMEEFLRERISKRAAKAQAQKATKDQSASSKTIERNPEKGFAENAESAATVLTDELKSWFGKKDKPKAEGAKEKPEISEGMNTVLGIIGTIVILLVIALIFNWFGIRTALMGFLINALMYIWIFGLLIFLLMLLFNKIKVMDGKRFLIKLVFFVAVGGISYIILVYVVDFLAKLR